MSRRTRVCATAPHPPREHPGCSGCGCHCHPGKPAPPDFREQIRAAQAAARQRLARERAAEHQEDTPDA